MKALITGGAGFIGSHLAERLLNLGHDVAVMPLGKRRQGRIGLGRGKTHQLPGNSTPGQPPQRLVDPRHRGFARVAARSGDDYDPRSHRRRLAGRIASQMNRGCQVGRAGRLRQARGHDRSELARRGIFGQNPRLLGISDQSQPVLGTHVGGDFLQGSHRGGPASSAGHPR